MAVFTSVPPTPPTPPSPPSPQIPAAESMPRRAALRFSKMHGPATISSWSTCATARRRSTPALSRALADRHTGVGCDQLLTIEARAAPGAVASYRIWNADGSEAQQCGNGARCVAAWLVRDGQRARRALRAGQSRRARVASSASTTAATASTWACRDFAPRTVRCAASSDAQDLYALDVDGARIEFGAVSMGNPHAVVEVDDIDAAPVATLGPALQAHAAFPQSVNVGFAQVRARDRIAPARLGARRRRNAGLRQRCVRGGGDPDAARHASIATSPWRCPAASCASAGPTTRRRSQWSGPATFVFEGELSA